MPNQTEIKKPEFWKPSVATDIILFSMDNEDQLRLLLITRGREPFKGQLAFPGGFLDEDDADLEACALRELEEETGAKGVPLRLLTVLSDKDRDPRQNRVISVSYIGMVDGCPRVEGADDAASAEWVLVEHIAPDQMAFDHQKLLHAALEDLHVLAKAPVPFSVTHANGKHQFDPQQHLTQSARERLGVSF